MTDINIHRREPGRPAGQTGLTLFIAVITTSIVLAIGISILNITLKEYLLSGVARESEMAFYAADAGMECALYWDFSSEGGAFDMSTSTRPISCMGGNVSTIGGGGQAGVGGKASGVASTFQVQWGVPTLCAQVSVVKTNNTTDSTCAVGFVCTEIESKGYNRACTGLADPRIVERALRSEY